MDEKIFNYLVQSLNATDKCLDGVDVALKALIKQNKINKKQRLLNFVLSMLVFGCVRNISTLAKAAVIQGEKIKELEAKIVSEDCEEQKGE